MMWLAVVAPQGTTAVTGEFATVQVWGILHLLLFILKATTMGKLHYKTFDWSVDMDAVDALFVKKEI